MFGNEKCRKCIDAHNAINGRWCKVIKDYVEYASSPPCEVK